MLSPTLRRRPGTALAALGAACLVAAAAPAGASAAQTQTLTVKLPKAGQTTVATASVKLAKGASATVKARNGDGLIATGGVARSGRVAVLVARPQGDEGAGVLTFEVRGARSKPRGTRRVASAFTAAGKASTPGCKGGELPRLLAKTLARAGRSKADVAALGTAAGRRVCGQPAGAGDAALLAKLGLASGGSGGAGGGLQPGNGVLRSVTGSTRCPSWGRGGKTFPGAECRANLPVPPDAPPPQCGNGIDDDGDGQIDHRESDAVRPDPGCTNAKDETEAGEPGVSAECAGSSGVTVVGGQEELFLALNANCPSFDEVRVNTNPAAFTCTASVGSAAGATCVVWKHDAAATLNDGAPVTQLDMALTLPGAADCSVPATVTMLQAGQVTGELVEPIAGCAGGPGPGPGPGAQCADGVDNDADGQTDARDTASGDPDPGCASAGDGSETGEVGLPAGCDVQVGRAPSEPQDVRALVQSCGAITGVWYKPAGTPLDCQYERSSGETGNCNVVGATVGHTFGATTDAVLLSTWITGGATCGGPTTVAVTFADGSVGERRTPYPC